MTFSDKADKEEAYSFRIPGKDRGTANHTRIIEIYLWSLITLGKFTKTTRYRTKINFLLHFIKTVHDHL